MIELFGARLVSVPLAAVLFVVGVRRAPALAWTAAFFASTILVLALVNAEDVPATIGLGYALVNASETYLIVFAALVVLAVAWRAVSRRVRALGVSLRRR
ncbi:MAG TPA: hypothetical protein VFM93_13740 [Candidatus Limnocylindria bacterium]|nr:hypothetical protein [Candidatus Limnocylindria bacterium]